MRALTPNLRARVATHRRQAAHKLCHGRTYATISQSAHQSFDEDTDVLIVGSGGAGLTALLRSHHHGLRSILLEKTDLIGGTTALSGGGMWIPNNLYLKANGKYNDSFEKALNYMNHTIGDAGPAASAERRISFLRNGPRMIEFLNELGFQGRASGEYPNYYPDLPGGEVPRGVEPRVFNIKKLGKWSKNVRQWPSALLPIFTDETSRLFQHATSLSNLLYAARIVGPRVARQLVGHRPVTMGAALVSQLLHLNIHRNANIWLNSPIEELIVNDGKVIGAVVKQEGKKARRVQAKRGVLLVGGGFARNAQMRLQYQEHPIGDEWTVTQPGDQGDTIRIGMGLDAQVALMDDAWWVPTAVDPRNGERHFILWERSLPHSIIVDASASRFMNEAQSYVDAGHAIYARNREVSAIPAWLIIDSQHRKKYPLASLNPRSTPETALKSGFLFKGDSLEDLARNVGLDAQNLTRTVKRFNEMARTGKDEDFNRGGNKYDNFSGDRYIKPNPNLGALEKPPFYAMKIYPGDLGTKGGLLTDENARVIGKTGKPIEGLYASGNTTASVMGRTYPGPGSTLSPALTFAFVAVNHMAGEQL